MGKGVFELSGGRTVHISGLDLYSGISPADEDLNYLAYKKVEETVLQCLPSSFVPEGPNSFLKDDEGREIAYNGFFEVTLTEWDYDVYIGIRPRQDVDERYDFGINPLALSQLDKVATAFFDALSAYYDLQVKTGAYTSTPYIGSAKKAA